MVIGIIIKIGVQRYNTNTYQKETNNLVNQIEQNENN